jgi:putative secretion ATPase (PEP-CTERM system associated)
MYEEYFSLSGSPFKLSPDPKFFFGSRSHNKAMAYLHYGLKQAEGFIVITGPIGSGKTMVIGQLLDQLNATNIIAAQLLTSNIAPEELLDHILSAFRIEPEGEGRTGKLEAFEDYLFDQLNRGRRVLLIMDEAQNLPFETLEELRMLSNIDYDGTPLFQVFLVGQPEFRDTMQSPKLEQLRQRVIASYHLENLDYEEASEYILHRLVVAGWDKDPIFSEEAFERIYEETGGRPRRINTVCNRVMLYCALEDQHDVTADVASTVIAELHEEELEARDVDRAQPEPERPKAMPPVRTIAAETDADEEDMETEERLISGDDVVVSIDSARLRASPAVQTEEKQKESSAPVAPDERVADEDNKEVAPADIEEGDAMSAHEDETDAEESAPKTTAQKDEDEAPLDEAAAASDEPEEPEQDAPAEALSSLSVFDRLRARRAESGDDEPRSEATLEDVASAIATVSAGQKADFVDGALHDDADLDADEAPTVAAIAPLKSVQSKEWRRQVRRSIDETREELKGAHASVRRLRKSLMEMQRRRKDARDEIVATIQRAEDMLGDLRKTLR